MYPNASTLAAAYTSQLGPREDIPRNQGKCNAFSWGGEHAWLHGPDKPGGRVFCYFDDLFWPERACYSEFTGEYAAIRDFNSQSKHKKISQIAGLRWMRERARAWNEQSYVLHDFEHPLYSKNITPAGAAYRQLELEA